MSQPGASALILHGSDPRDVVRAAMMLRRGAVVVLPTDTGYGIAASLFHPAAVERVFDIKQRDPTARLPVHLPTAADLPTVVSRVPSLAWKLIGAFWPGPLSVVMPAATSVPRSVTGGKGTVAVRVPAGRTCLAVLETVGDPVTGTSANISGHPPALTAASVLEQLGTTVDAVLVDDAAVIHASASTIVEITDAGILVHRLGQLTLTDLRDSTSARVLPVAALSIPPERR